MSTVVLPHAVRRLESRKLPPGHFRIRFAGQGLSHGQSPRKHARHRHNRGVSVDWAQIDEIHNWDWQLYVLHWDKSKGCSSFTIPAMPGFLRIAKAVAGDNVEQIRGPKIFRCLAGVNRLKLQNVGLLEQLGRLIRYTMRAGSDVEPAMSEAQKQKAIKANLFGQGFEDGTPLDYRLFV